MPGPLVWRQCGLAPYACWPFPALSAVCAHTRRSLPTGPCSLPACFHALPVKATQPHPPPLRAADPSKPSLLAQVSLSLSLGLGPQGWGPLGGR